MSRTIAQSNAKLTDREIREYRSAFKMFDSDGDGHINHAEMKSILRACGEDPSDEEVQGIMKELDVDGGGAIEFDEFVFMMEKRASALSEEQELKEAFKFFDRNETGYITGRKLFDGLKALDETVKSEEVRSLMRAADFDDDGRVSFLDFTRFFTMAKKQEKDKKS